MQSFFWYAFSTALSRLAGIILVPIYVKSLSIEDVGHLEFLLAIYTLMVLTSGLQSESCVLRFYNESDDIKHKQSLFWNSVLTSIFGFIAVCVFTILLIICKIFKTGEALLLLSLILPTQIIGIQLVLLRCSGEYIKFSVLSFFDFCMTIIFTIILVSYFKLGVTGALLGVLFVKTLCVFVFWPSTMQLSFMNSLDFNKKIKYAFFGIKSVPAVLANWAQNFSSRLFLSFFYNLTDVATTGIAIKIASVFGLIIYCFRLSWEPYAIKMLISNNKDFSWLKDSIIKYSKYALIICLTLMFVSPFVADYLAGPEYLTSGPLAAFFICGQYWVGFMSISTIGISFACKTFDLFPVFCIGAILNLLITIALASFINVYAAGLGFLVGSIASAILAVKISQKYISYVFPKKVLIFSIACTIIAPIIFSIYLNKRM